ncbi:unnamed protein product [Cuscuta epithymum]|uniref:YDG domain-containing protein n=1 Tax=Cuscuta epithymum TaxID=186058 RepID=A0AAV0CUE3_9ASTE|nr:unnamed protein product [Cuscuta epithymum]
MDVPSNHGACAGQSSMAFGMDFFYYIPENEAAIEYDEDCIYLFSERYNLQESRRCVEKALNHYRDELKRHVQGNAKVNHVLTAVALRSQKKWVNCEKLFIGHVPGVTIGDEFQHRAEIALVGLHHPFVEGINYVNIHGKNYAISIVDASRYVNRRISLDSFVYVGQGRNPSVNRNNPKDQRLINGYLSLKNSMEYGVPVRVIRGKDMYVYDGLFHVKRCWVERESYGKMTFNFELHRIAAHPPPTGNKVTNNKIISRSKKSPSELSLRGSKTFLEAGTIFPSLCLLIWVPKCPRVSLT